MRVVWLALSCLLGLLVSPAQATIPNTVGWHTLANTRIDSVCAFSPCDGITTAWNSALFDTNRQQFVLMNNGGHGDYAGNEIIAVDLDTETISLVRNASPVSYSGACTLADGTPRSFHTYSNVTYIKSTDQYLSLGGARAPDGFMQNCVWTYTPSTNTYAFHANSPIDRNGGFWGSAVAYDDERNVVWASDQFNVYRMNTSTKVWTTPTQTSFNGTGDQGDMNGVIDYVRDRYYVIGNGVVWYWSISNSASIGARQVPTLTGCSGAFTGATGVTYDPTQDRIVSWHGGNTVYLLNPATHTCTTQTVSGGPAQTANGTYGRFRYSEKYHVFITCQAVSSNCMALRLTVQSADTDWNRRKNGPGVTAYEGFDTIGDYTNGVKYFNGDGGFDGADMDTTIKTSGTGALRFNLPAGRGTSNISGDFRVCLRAPCVIDGDDTQSPGFGFPSDFWISYRMRISATMVTNLLNHWRAGAFRTGWKSINLHNGSHGSCCAVELTKTIDINFPNGTTQIWYKDGGTGLTTNSSAVGNGGSPYMQQGNLTAGTSTNGYWCDWNNNESYGTGNGAGCFGWRSPWQAVWVTFIDHYQIGNNGAATSTLESWIYADGSSLGLQMFRITGETLTYGSNPVGERTYNQISFTPYMTGLSTSAPVDAFVWFDEFIASTNPIDSPGQVSGSGGADTTPPAVPTGVTIN